MREDRWTEARRLSPWAVVEMRDVELGSIVSVFTAESDGVIAAFGGGAGLGIFGFINPMEASSVKLFHGVVGASGDQAPRRRTCCGRDDGPLGLVALAGRETSYAETAHRSSLFHKSHVKLRK